MITEKLTQILDKVEKPARYIGGELNQAYKENYSINMAMAFPDIYEIGESNLGLKILYHILNKEADTFCQRVYAPAKDMKALMEKENIPLFTLEQKTPLNELHIIGFSLAYELCYPTLLTMLKLGNIPIYSTERTNAHPIIVAGGHCTCNPAPVSPFIDAFCIGDGEEIIINIKNAVRDNKGNRKAILQALAKCDGVYVPQIHTEKDTVFAGKVRDFENSSFPTNPIVPHIGVIHDRVMLEIMRGCTRGCRFCQAGMITRPLRERSKETLIKQAQILINATGYEEIALTSLSSTDHSQIKSIIEDLTKKYIDTKIGISLPSIRADVDCVELAQSISKIRKSGLTFAPEAGSQRLRNVINKNLTEEDLLNAVSSALKNGWKTIKLYFMIGLPYETDEDILGISYLLQKVMRLSKEMKAGLNLRVTISPFVPKPHTPFQWRPMDTEENLERKIKLLRDHVKNKSIQLSWHNPTTSKLEAALARGTKDLSQVIFNSARNGAYLEQDDYSLNIWEKAFSDANLYIDDFAHKEFSHQDVLPWENINVGVSKQFLINEDLKAQQGITTPSCKYSSCAGCGINKYFKTCPPKEAESQEEKSSTANVTKIEYENPIIHKNTGTAVFTFSKKNNLRFIGHLDLMGIFEKAVRISKIPVWYSEGFNPHPKISLPMPLPLGAECEADILAIRIYYPCDSKKILEDLNNALPKDIRLTSIAIIEEEKRISQPNKSLYELKINNFNTVNLQKLQNAKEIILSKEKIIFERSKGRDVKDVDIRPYIEEISISENSIFITVLHKTNSAKPMELFKLFKEIIPELELKLITRKKIIW